MNVGRTRSPIVAPPQLDPVGATEETPAPSASVAPTDSFEEGPADVSSAEPRTQVFDDGSRLYQFADGRTGSLPSADQHHAWATQELSRRLGISEGDASERLSDLATRLGPDGDTVLADALATGRMNLALAGISGAGGGARSAQDLASVGDELSRITGRQSGVVLDNPNGAGDAWRASANRGQQETLERLLRFNRDAGITTNVAVHSNGVNALSEALRTTPDARLGQVNLVDVNVAGTRQQATEQLSRIVAAARETSLVTTAYDAALGVSRAGGPLSTLIGAAASAGVQHIRVLPGTEHPLDQVRAALEQEGRRGELDFRRDPSTGRTLPVDPQAWAQLRYQFTNGRLIYRP